jgi:hypothetical protein
MPASVDTTDRSVAAAVADSVRVRLLSLLISAEAGELRA